MKILVTAGSTQVPIDRVRCISNIFKGRTGVGIAEHAARRLGQKVTLMANPGASIDAYTMSCINCLSYKTFDELEALMREHIEERPLINPDDQFDVIIHSSAVSDFRVKDVYDGKIKSSKDELVLHLVKTPKLVDSIRFPWGFKGLLVKFKLEVGVTEDDLLEIATNSKKQSKANYIVANRLDDFKDWETSNMYITDPSDNVTRVSRKNLAHTLLDMIDIN